MSSRKRTSYELAHQIRTRYERGESVIELATSLGMSRQGIYQAIYKAGGKPGRIPPRTGLLAWLDE